LNAPELSNAHIKNEIRKTIQSYAKKPVKPEGVDLLVRYIQDNMHLLAHRPQTFVKGDWNTENLILMPDGEIGVIDLGGDGNCDPWCEFWEIPSDLNSVPHFYRGQIDGYFNGEPPVEYFPLLAFYIAFGTLKWEYNCQCVLDWFDNMRNPVPAWYLPQKEAQKQWA
jgi:serine/threonine-protein kinase